MPGPTGYVDLVPLFATTADRNNSGTWEPGDLAYNPDDGYAWYDGTQWKRFGTALQQLGYVNRDTDVNVPAGQTITALTTTVTITDQTQLLLRSNLPAFELTNTAGGEAAILAVVGGNSHAIGHMLSDRQFMWPASMARRVDVTPGETTIELRIQAITNPCLAHAGGLYGNINLQILG